MGKVRSIFAFVMIFAWTAIPALACLPSASMTQAEMACCKKMAGDCHMGTGQHPCCQTKADRPGPVATLDRATPDIHPALIATLLPATLGPEPRIDHIGSLDLRGLPPPAPPGFKSVLRI